MTLWETAGMDDWTKVRVRVDENGQLEVEVDGDIDKSKLTEERRPATDLPEETAVQAPIWGF